MRVWCAVESRDVVMFSPAARSADRGGAAGGGVGKRLWLNVYGYGILFEAVK